MRRLSNVDYSQGLPTPMGLGFISALMNSPVPAEVVALRPDEVEKVGKWVEGPNALKRAQGLMKSAFHQIVEGRPDPAARLVISAATLAGYGWRENPELASRIIETARRVVHHALNAKSNAMQGLDDEMIVLSEVDPYEVHDKPEKFRRLNKYFDKSIRTLVSARQSFAHGNIDEAMVKAREAKEYGRIVGLFDKDAQENIDQIADDVYKDAIVAFASKRVGVAGIFGPVNYFDSKGTMWGASR